MTNEPTESMPNKKAETQERIVAAAMELFLRRGFERTSVAQIAAKAGVSRATIFWHFGNKQSLFRASSECFLVPFREALAGRLARLEPRKRLSELFAMYEAFVHGNRPNIVAFVRRFMDSPREAEFLRDGLLSLHESFRSEIEVALRDYGATPDHAVVVADGFLSLLDGNLLLAILGADPEVDERRRRGLRAVADAALSEIDAGLGRSSRALGRHDPTGPWND